MPAGHIEEWAAVQQYLAALRSHFRVETKLLEKVDHLPACFRSRESDEGRGPVHEVLTPGTACCNRLLSWVGSGSGEVAGENLGK